MKKFLAILLSMLMACSLFITCFTFDVSAASTNIAKGKSYTQTGKLTAAPLYPDESGKDLTDGVIGATAAECTYSNTLWSGFGSGYASPTDSITVDLESVQSGLISFDVYALHFNSGIARPNSVDVAISSDNVNYVGLGITKATRIVDASVAGNAATALFGNYKYELKLDASVSARYVRFTVLHGNNLSFLSEVEVYQDATAPVATTAEKRIVIDGKLDDFGWDVNGWTNVNNITAKLGTELKEGDLRKENYDVQFKSDDTNLYVGVKFNATPVATNTKNGNGAGTNFRLWTFADGANVNGTNYITFNYLFNYCFRPDGSSLYVTHNTNPLGNTQEYIPMNISTASTYGDGYWYIEMAIPFSAMGMTDAGHFYTTLSSPTSITGATPSEATQNNNSWNYPKYGAGMESNVNADTMYTEWDTKNDLDLKFADVKLGALPTTAQPIDNFGDYASGTSTIMTRVAGATTLGEISLKTLGSTKDYNYFYLAAVNANNKVVAINQKLGRKVPPATETVGEKDAFVVPEGGYVLLCNANPSETHTQAMIDAFKAIKVGDIISLYNVDRAALALGATKLNLTDAKFNVSSGKFDYVSGVTMEADPAQVSEGDPLNVLSDGKTELVDATKDFGDEQVILFTNKVCKTADTFPVVNLILNLGGAEKFDTVNLSFYHQYGVMIGLPKDNKITVSYSNDPSSFTLLGDYTFQGAAAEGTKGVLPANLALGKTINAQYIKISFAFGKAPWETDGKTNWEFIGMTEFGVSSTAPAAGYTNLSNADQVVANKVFTTLGDNKTALADATKKFNDAQVVLFQNQVCKTSGTFPKVELVLAYASAKTIDTINFGFYHEYDVMIGLPKDNKVSISYSNDNAAGYTSLGDLTLEGTAAAGTNGVIATNYKLNSAIKARYIKISFEFGKAPWETDGKTNWEFIGMTEFSTSGYAEGVTNLSVSGDVGVSNNRSLRALIDGNVAPSIKTLNNGAVVLFQNKKCTQTATPTTPIVYPTVDLIFTFNQAKAIDTAKFSFYHEYDSMIGLPKDNKVTISYANNYNDFTAIGDYTITGTAETGKSGVIDAIIPLGKTVTAKYVRVSFKYGDSPFTPKNLWEFIALTEASFDSLNVSTIDPAIPDVVVSKDKSYTGSTAARSGWTDKTPATLLTDGDLGTLDKLGGNGPFVGFQVVKNIPYTYTSGAWVAGSAITYTPDERDSDGTFYKVIDLGQNISSIYKYSVKFGQITDYNILFPSKVEFYASIDGIDFYKMGEGVKGTVEDNTATIGTGKLKELVDYTFTATTGVSARYIKVAVTPAAFPDIAAPTDAGTEAQVKTVSKALVTALSEITVISNIASGVVYSDKAPVTTNYAYNTALNKDWFGIDYHPLCPTYTGDFTDGNYAPDNNFSWGDPWFAFYRNGENGNISTSLYGEVTIDLGSDGKALGGLRMQVAPVIGEATSIKVFASNNGIAWDEVGTVTYTGTDIQWATCTFAKELDARYIKVGVQNKDMFFMVSEIQVIRYIPLSKLSVDFANQYTVGYQGAGWVYNGGESLASVGDAVYVFTPDKGATLAEAANANIAWWDIWTVDYDTDNLCYYIKAFYPQSGSNKGDIAIPAKGFVVAANGHGRLSIDDALRANYAVGAPVYVYDMDILNLGVKDTMDFVKTNTISVFLPIDGKTEYVPDFTPDLPEGAQVINNFGDYVGSTTTIYTRVNDKTTLGEVAEITFGTAKDFNMFYLVSVDSTGKVVEINQTTDVNKSAPSIKKGVVIPEGGYLILCSSAVNETTHTQAAIDEFLKIAVGDTVTLYNVDLTALATGAVKKDLTKAGFTYVTDPYKVGVNNVSDSEKVGVSDDLSVLSDGKTALTDPSQNCNDEQVKLFQNKLTATAGTYPTVELVLKLENAQTFNTVDLSFYREYISMVGLPKDNKVTISYATEPDKFATLGDYTFAGTCNEGELGVVPAKLVLGTSINAQYVKIAFSYGDSPFAGSTPSKPVWEWLGLTEFAVSTTAVADLPAGAQIINNFGGFSASTTLYTRCGGKTTIGDVSEYIRGEAQDYNYAYLVAVDANGKVTAVNQTTGRPAGVKDTFVIPEGGYVLLCNLNTSADTHTQAMIDTFKAIKEGQIITLYNVDLKALATSQTEINLEKAGFTVKDAEATDPFALKDPSNTKIQVKDGLLLGIKPGMTVDEVKALFAGAVTVSKVGTGATITAGDKTIKIIIRGDIDGDGIIDSTDYLYVKKAILGNMTLNAEQLKAACVRGGTAPDSEDYLFIKKHILGNYDLFA